jgi:hypothetical protein
MCRIAQIRNGLSCHNEASSSVQARHEDAAKDVDELIKQGRPHAHDDHRRLLIDRGQLQRRMDAIYLNR